MSLGKICVTTVELKGSSVETTGKIGQVFRSYRGVKDDLIYV